MWSQFRHLLEYYKWIALEEHLGHVISIKYLF